MTSLKTTSKTERRRTKRKRIDKLARRPTRDFSIDLRAALEHAEQEWTWLLRIVMYQALKQVQSSVRGPTRSSIVETNRVVRRQIATLAKKLTELESIHGIDPDPFVVYAFEKHFPHLVGDDAMFKTWKF